MAQKPSTVHAGRRPPIPLPCAIRGASWGPPRRREAVLRPACAAANAADTVRGGHRARRQWRTSTPTAAVRVAFC